MPVPPPPHAFGRGASPRAGCSMGVFPFPAYPKRNYINDSGMWGMARAGEWLEGGRACLRAYVRACVHACRLIYIILRKYVMDGENGADHEAANSIGDALFLIPYLHI